ncbi:MAG: glutamate-5-semialdehyde dehydrogenase [Nitrospirae bacterium]|nr:glutamate-5-semialdehyde dehydrogenase [Nitrospirota bacterium]
MDLSAYVKSQAQKAKAAARPLAALTTAVKNRALLEMAQGLSEESPRLLRENARDLEAASASGLSSALIDRLRLNADRIQAMADGLREVAALPDPVGEVVKMWRRPNGMTVGRVRVPIGCIGMIYESRPNVTADSAGLCLKSGNTVLLRGGSEAIHSNRTIAEVLTKASAKSGIPEGAIAFLDSVDREAIREMIRLEGIVDLIIPRGGEGLMRFVVEYSRIPVIKHDKGLCHTYVDEAADLKMAEAIAFNAKVQRPATCNAMETLLVHEAVDKLLLPRLAERLRASGVEIRGCPRTRAILPDVRAVSEEDFHTEYLDLILNVKVVQSFEEALEHIAAYGSQHSEAIVTRDYGRAQRFLREVDAAAVFVNASTRLHDGYQFGLGAEIGISTTRIHARGAMGLEELTSTKFIVYGEGQLRE